MISATLISVPFSESRRKFSFSRPPPHHRSCWLEKITKLIPVHFSFPISSVYTFPDERVNCPSRYIRSRPVPFILRPSGKRRFYLDRLRERDKSFIFEDKKKKKCFLREKEREKEEESITWFKLRSWDPSSTSRDVQTHLLHSGVILVGISEESWVTRCISHRLLDFILIFVLEHIHVSFTRKCILFTL